MGQNELRFLKEKLRIAVHAKAPQCDVDNLIRRIKSVQNRVYDERRE